MPHSADWISEPIRGLLEERDYGQALPEIERELLADPQSFSLWVAKIIALSGSENTEELLSGCDHLIQMDPNNPIGFLLKGNILQSLDRDDEALTCYETAIALEPTDAGTLSLGARVLSRLGRIAEALELYDRIDQLSPGNPDYLIGKGDVLLSAGRVDEALLAFEKAAELAPASFGAVDWDTRGDTLYERENLQMALRFYEKAIAANSGYAWAYRGKARVLNRLLHQPDGALEQLDVAIGIDPQNAWFYLDKGTIFYDRNDYKNAAECYRKATELDPKYEAAWSNLGLAQEFLECYEDAVLSLQKAIELNPLSIDAWLHQGFCLGCLRKFEEAEACYRKSLELEPDNTVATGNMGWVLGRLKRDEEALPYERKYIEFSPGDAVAWLNEAESLINLNRWPEALERLKSGVELASDPHDLLARIGSIYADFLFQHEKALEYYQQCLSRRPEDAEVGCGVVECLVITGRYAEGRAKANKLFERLTPDLACGLSLVVLTSYALEQDLEGRARQFDKIVQHFASLSEERETNKGAASAWNFAGLINKIRMSTIPAESKFLILTCIDIDQGRVNRGALTFFQAANPRPEPC